MTAPVLALPTLSPLALVATRGRGLPAPLDGARTSFWYSARTALWHAVGALGLRSGDAVAVPAYCCGSELEGFTQAGVRLRPFALTERLDPEPRSFAQALDGAAAALVTHYFGVPADLEAPLDACRRQGVPLVEDCAHALYSTDGDGALGLRGEAAVFSLWKTLALPDGGALVLRRGTPGRGAEPPAAAVRGRTRHLVVQHLRAHPSRAARLLSTVGSGLKRSRRGKAAVEKPSSAEERSRGEYEALRLHPEQRDWTMSRRARRLFLGVDHEDVKHRRRARYAELAGALIGLPRLRPLFPSLPDGACPLFFPVRVDGVDGFRRALAGAGVQAHHFWTWFHPDIPWTDFPHEARLKRETMALPVHQSLRDGDVARLIAVVRAWARS